MIIFKIFLLKIVFLLVYILKLNCFLNLYSILIVIFQRKVKIKKL
jgi:hypothetical protein